MLWGSSLFQRLNKNLRQDPVNDPYAAASQAAAAVSAAATAQNQGARNGLGNVCTRIRQNCLQPPLICF